jgi:hypothetical protein
MHFATLEVVAAAACMGDSSLSAAGHVCSLRGEQARMARCLQDTGEGGDNLRSAEAIGGEGRKGSDID